MKKGKQLGWLQKYKKNCTFSVLGHSLNSSSLDLFFVEGSKTRYMTYVDVVLGSYVKSTATVSQSG